VIPVALCGSRGLPTTVSTSSVCFDGDAIAAAPSRERQAQCRRVVAV
jgi:hypothetical protein